MRTALAAAGADPGTLASVLLVLRDQMLSCVLQDDDLRAPIEKIIEKARAIASA
jgi:hypothetical protein